MGFGLWARGWRVVRSCGSEGEPGDSYYQGGGGAGGEQPAGGYGAVMARACCDHADQGCEAAHREDGADAKASEITERRCEAGQRERGEDAEEVRASGEAVQDADAEGGPCAVGMGVRVDAGAERAMEAPEADADQNDTDHALAPGRERRDGQPASQQQAKQADEDDAVGMAEAPEGSRAPGASIAVAGERCYGGEVIRAGQDVYESREYSCQGCEDHLETMSQVRHLRKRLL
jgi:hypothetical protein